MLVNMLTDALGFSYFK